MRQIVGITGLCTAAFAIAWYFDGIHTGACVGLFLIGAALIVDALKK